MPHATTAVITREIGIHIFETLLALDAKYQPVPHLIEGHDVLDGGRRYVLRLRKDVKFHNGKALGSADVVASLRRWGGMATTGKAMWKNVEAVEAKGPATVEIRLKERLAALLTALGRSTTPPSSIPEEVIKAAGDGQIKEFIGTGPFRFVEHRPDRHIKLARFDGYVPRSEPASGLAGRAIAYLDELYFMPVPDYATRQAGIMTGEYAYIQQVKGDQYERIRSTPGVEPVVVKPYGWVTMVLNTKQGVMADKRVRQAIQAALDIEPMMLAGMGHKDFYRLDPGLFFQEQVWHSKAGAALYNQRDKDKARRLLKEAGYGGQPVRWIVTTEYEHHYKPALVGKAQLEEIGLKIDLQVSDWATVVQRRNKPELWDVFTTAFVFPTGAEHVRGRCSASGRAGGATRRRSSSSRRWEGAGPEEALRDLGEDPDDLLRGRRADQGSATISGSMRAARTSTATGPAPISTSGTSGWRRSSRSATAASSTSPAGPPAAEDRSAAARRCGADRRGRRGRRDCPRSRRWPTRLVSTADASTVSSPSETTTAGLESPAR